MVAQQTVSAGSRRGQSANPQVHPAAAVHEFSFLEGDVRLDAGVMIAPGTAVTAESGASVVVSEGCSLLPGVLVEGRAGAQVVNHARESSSVWLGDRTVIAHKSIIHSPAFVGKDCFVGFRSTIFNARLGDGCVVMMHALVQDVEVPPGKCVPSGSVITSQHQADQLPSVRPEDREFAKEIAGSAMSVAGRSASHPAKSRLIPIPTHGYSTNRPTSGPPSSNYSPNQPYATPPATLGADMPAQRLSADIVQQVRQYLSQGYRVGMEHADSRRYRSGVWETCTPIKETQEQAVFAALERCLSEHQGEYVRMFGIDTQLKRRMGMVTVQRPDGRAIEIETKSVPAARNQGGQSSRSYSANGSNHHGDSSSNSDGLTSGIEQEVRNLLSSGYIIGTEHAGPRHYRSNVWKSCSPIKSTREPEVLSHLKHCLDEHRGEYVRMFGIDPKLKRRTSTTTIQRADGKPVEVSAHTVPQASASGQSQSYSQSSDQRQGYSQNGGGNIDGDVAQAVSQIIRNGNRVGVEVADQRRYRSGIWQTEPKLNASSESAVIAQLQKILSQHSDKYVRIFGVNTQMKTRGTATTVQKPGQSGNRQSSSRSGNGYEGVSGTGPDPINANPPHYDDPAYRGQPSSYNRDGYSDRSGGLDPKIMDQVTQLVNQGHKISIEYADKRRYRSGIWKTGAAISARRPAEAISALGKQLAQHRDDYVKLVGIDSQAKRRVVEMTIQKPGQGLTDTGPDPINANPPHYDDPAYRGQPSSYSSDHYSSDRVGGGYSSSGYGSSNGGNNGGSSGGSNGGSNGSSGLESHVMDQVTQLVNQGHRISVEYADKRRYRSGIWKTGEAIDARRPAEAISALGKQLARHQGEYVRLIGVDPQAKRRVLETTIQRP